MEKFGTTNNFDQAGFALTDGRMLNLSRYGQSGVQHKIIEGIYDDTKGNDAVTRFVQEGNIRIKASSPGIEIGTETAARGLELGLYCRKRKRLVLDVEDGLKPKSKAK